MCAIQCQLDTAAILVLLMPIIAACGEGTSTESPSTLNAYLTDARYRRSELVSSLVNPANDYSRLRLAHYESGDTETWSRLPEWNPPTTRFDVAGDATSVEGSGPRESLHISNAARAGSEGALLALGEAAFFAYPMQLAPAARNRIHSTADADRYGLWSDPAHGTGGLVSVGLPDGTTELAQTCATCHSGIRDGVLVVGAPNERLDWGALLVDGTPYAADNAAALLQWGPGRIDVTTTSGEQPCRIVDLRPVRWLTHLHQDATVAQRSITSLAIRIETLIITTHGQVLRPPREVSLGLALYVRSLAAGLSQGDPSTRSEQRGAALFDGECSGCHAEPGFTGPPVPIAVAGTDPTFGNSADRGTGMYRVPSLLGVALRGPLLHDGKVRDVDALFDPNRIEPNYDGALHGSGPVPGHLFGLDLIGADRDDLLAFLHTLR